MILYILSGIAFFLLILLILGRPKEDGKEKKKANITIISTIASVIVGIVLVFIGGMLAAIFGGK
ncbi:MAG TPA: hypothetical protein PK723_03220 [Candidatus Pacearchaeota archaeon]|nr:hypothetical protein [Candidatus Pacearchaeota archaeon]HPZ74809.1 hypothetical protein [Candidatus Pacearchaeota archaeon]